VIEVFIAKGREQGRSFVLNGRKKAIGRIGKVKVNELPKPREGRRTTYLRMRLRGDRQRIVFGNRLLVYLARAYNFKS